VAQDYLWGLGRRKTAVARVRIRPGTGKILINGRAFDDYFCLGPDRERVVEPLRATQTFGTFDVWANLRGGGTTGQVGAMVMGLGRALLSANSELEGSLRDGKFLTRDSRMVERKKYGKKKARKSFQFSKR
jgi:small subunit ribosomal protein S9